MASLVPVILLGGTTAYISSYYVREQAIRFASDMAREKAQSIINLQKPVESVGRHIVSDSNMLDAMFDEDSYSSISEIRVKALIEKNLAHYFSLEGLTAISIILNEGRTYSLNLEVELTNIDRQAFQSQVDSCLQAEASTLCWPGIQSNINRASAYVQVLPAIQKMYRLNEESMEQEHIGYLYMAFSPVSYRKMLMQQSSDDRQLLVLDATNRIVFHNDSKMVGLPVPSNMLPEKDGLPYRVEVYGESFFFVSHRSGLSGWRFIIMVPEEQILQGMYQTLSIAAGLIVLSLGFILFAWVNIRRRVLKPIEALSIAMRDKEKSILGHEEDKFELKDIRDLLFWYNKYVEIVEDRDKQSKQLREAFEELKLTQSQLIESEKMAALGKLVAGVAHEINTPLAIALTSVTFSKELNEDLERLYVSKKIDRSDLEEFIEQNKQGADISINNLNRVVTLVNTFKTVATDQHVEELQTFLLAEYLTSTVISFKPKLKLKNVEIKWDCDEGLELYSYPGILWQILSNLVMNSLVHGYEESEKGTIQLLVTLNNDKVHITYSDDGSGMSKEVQESIFLPFFTTKRHNGGTGLGMHIVYNLVVQKLQGSISCESKEGEGTQFYITLPKSIEP
ncbi:ATP-binding protein [Vibrio sp. 10N.261.55.A7]|uniref:sensor histidine kinase n=1 Tax=Vibrio sp. 10N.261.55.A7 TaxID=1880851 RepID=UPI001055816D|nr:ATP-binding protein [Vibrio sp. 10N.261.55.A7]